MTVYSVAQITTYLRASLEADPVLRDVWVDGEVSNLATSGAGHLYFTLKDADGQLRCIMFRSRRGRNLIQEGASVLAHGRISFYEVRGDLRFYVDLVQPEGVGELALKLEQLKLRLEEEGLFEPSRKRPTPAFPRRVAVVTSPTGSVWHDIQNVVRRRYPLVELALAPTPVQGDDAARGIVEALQAVNEDPSVDVVIVARGGGSLEELWPFNEEIVARAIYASHPPVVSGVGHETDVTITDLVADVRAPTPSAAAEVVVPDRAHLLSQAAARERAASDAMTAVLYRKRQQVESAVSRLHRHMPDSAGYRQRIGELLRAAQRAVHGALALHHERVTGMSQQLEALNPHRVLERGYAIVQHAESDDVVAHAQQVTAGDQLHVRLASGRLRTVVEETLPEGDVEDEVEKHGTLQREPLG